MTNFGISVTDTDLSLKKPYTKLFRVSSLTGLDYPLRKIIESEFKIEEKWKSLKGYAYAPELGKAWKYNVKYSKKPELGIEKTRFDIKKTEIEYPKGITKTEDLFSEYSFKTIKPPYLKPKTLRLKRKLNQLILKYEGIGVYYFITTGIDYNLKYFKSAIGTGDREYIENLIRSGKKVSIIVVSNYPQITSRVPLYIEYVPVEEYVSKHPSISSILKLKFNDLPN